MEGQQEGVWRLNLQFLMHIQWVRFLLALDDAVVVQPLYLEHRCGSDTLSLVEPSGMD